MKSLICLAVVVFVHLQAEAQLIQENITFTIPLKERKITAHEIVNVILKIKNNQKRTSSAWIKVAAAKELQLLSKEVIPLKLSPGDSLFMPVKLFVPEKTPSGLNYNVTFSLEDSTGTLHKESCKLIMGIEKNVILSTQISSIVLNGVNDSINIPVRVSNKGNTSQKVNVIARFPSALQSNGFHHTVQLMLYAFADTTIYIRKKVNRELLNFDEFTVNISGVYLNGDMFGVGSVNIQTLKNVRYRNINDIEQEKYIGNYNNMLSLVTQNFGSEFAAFQLMGGGAVDLPKSRIGYHIDATIFQNFPDAPYLRNTYLSYETRNVGISAGNITRNFDLNLNGRGVSAFFADTANLNHYEVGYIDNASNLIAPNNYIYDSGRSIWSKFEHQDNRLKYRTVLIHNKDPFVKVNNTMISNEVTLFTKQKFRISGALSGGRTSDYNSGNGKLGILGAANFDGRIDKFTISSANLVSSGYYPGIRKGSSIFSERLNYALKNINLWTSYSYINSEPKFISSYMSFSSKYKNTKIELGVSKLFNRLSVSLSPVYQTETGRFFLSADDSFEASLISKRLLTQINYSGSKQSVFLGVEAGIVSSTLNSKSESQFKLNGSYHYGIFNLSTNLQYGNFFVNEILNNYLKDDGKYSNVSITPTLQKTMFRGRTRIEGGLSYNKISNSGVNILLTGRVEYNMSVKTQFFASLSRSQYNFNQHQFNYNNLQFGIAQKIPNIKLGAKNRSLEVTLYKDENQNGIRDEGDGIASGQVVYINGTAFITDKLGKITYKNLPEGEYKISLSGQGKWYASEHRIHLNKKNVKTELALTKTGTLKGSISYSYNDYSYEINKGRGGIIIQATDENGFVTKTKTNDSGQFVFYLPTGTYTVAVDRENLPEEVECTNNNQVYKIDQDAIEKLSFDLIIKTRKIETKRFISPSLRK